MQHVDGAGEPHRVDGAIRAPGEFIDDFEDARAAEASQRLRIGMLAPLWAR
jgi:hypothetical protein